MKLIVLGSGASMPSQTRSSSAYWLESGAARILLDCSSTAIQRCLAEGLDPSKLDAIWISHFHLDHCAGLFSFLAGTRHWSRMSERKKPLRIFGPKGLRRLIDTVSESQNYKLLDQPFSLEIIEVDSLEKFEIGPHLTAVASKTPHTPESLAIHLRDSDDTTFVFTGDTGVSELIATFSRGVDLLLIEACFPKVKPTENHLNFDEARFLIRKANPRRAILTHLHPDWDEVDAESMIAEANLGEKASLAYDGLRIEFFGSQANQ